MQKIQKYRYSLDRYFTERGIIAKQLQLNLPETEKTDILKKQKTIPASIKYYIYTALNPSQICKPILSRSIQLPKVKVHR